MATKPPAAPKPVKTPVESINDSIAPAIEQIPFDWVDRSSNKTTKLLANSGDIKSIEGQNRWYRYEFKEPRFIYRIVILLTNYPDYKDFELKATTESGKTTITSTRPSSGRVVLQLNEFCTSVEFKPPKAYFTGKKTLDCIEIYGFDKNSAGNFIQFCRDIDDYKSTAITQISARENVANAQIAKAEVANADAARVSKECNDLKAQADRTKAAIKRLESNRDELSAKITALDESLATNERTLDSTRSRLNDLTVKQQLITSDIESKSDELKSLKGNLDLFPSELSDFVRQGAKNTKTLFWLAAAPIAMIVGMFFLLISGAVELTTKITENQNINIEALFVSRMPYVAVAITIITACYKIARAFILELISVNRQRLNLTKISIIAKDISNSTLIDSNLTEDEKSEARLRIKMDLLRDHLKNYISPDFEPSLPRSINLSVFQARNTREDGEAPDSAPAN